MVVVRFPLWLPLLLVLAVGACGVGSPGLPGAEGAIVRTASGAPLSEVPAVERFVVREDLPLIPSAVWLVEGKVSSVSEGRIRRNDPPSTLTEARQPLTTWTTDEGTLAVPGAVLEPGGTYSLIALGVGVLATFQVAPGPVAILAPASPVVTRGGVAVYCRGAGDYGRSLDEQQTETMQMQPARWGLGDEVAVGHCVQLEVPSSGEEVFVPPAAVGDTLFFDPTPLLVLSATSAMAGTTEELHIAERTEVQGSSLFFEAPAGFSIFEWRKGSKEGELLSVTYFRGAEGVRLPLGIAAPGQYRLGVATVDFFGRISSEWVDFSITTDAAHLTLTEVLSNPLGPEPQSEWVELVNLGRRSISLSGYRLADAVRSVELPDVVLPAGGFGVIVREDYRAVPELDPVPAPDAVAIVVPEISSGGLLNAGEALHLLDPTGRLVSSVPAVETRAGVSLARRELLSPDLVGSFSPHADPGSSPGSPNEFAVD